MPQRKKYILIGAVAAVALAICVVWAVTGLTRQQDSAGGTGPGTANHQPNKPEESSQSAASDPSGDTTGPSIVPPTTLPVQMDPVVTEPVTTEPVATEPVATETTKPESSKPAVTDPTDPLEPSIPAVVEKLEILQWGRYSGEYVEDGSDEQVQHVAVILVRNNTDHYLDYAQMVLDIDGQAGRFVVMGLPPGESAWVLEKNRMEISADAQFRYADGSAGYKPAEPASTLPLSIAGGKGQITLTNIGTDTLKNVYVYYKQRHKDGHFLGGILYRKGFGDLEPGETVSELAGHFDPDKVEIVRITCDDES